MCVFCLVICISSVVRLTTEDMYITKQRTHNLAYIYICVCVCVHIFVCVSSVVSPPLYGSNRESVNVSLGIDKQNVSSIVWSTSYSVCASTVVSP